MTTKNYIAFIFVWLAASGTLWGQDADTTETAGSAVELEDDNFYIGEYSSSAGTVVSTFSRELENINGGESSDPIKLYIPIGGTDEDGVDRADYVVFDSVYVPNNTTASATSQAHFGMRLERRDTSGRHYLRAAVKETDSNYINLLVGSGNSAISFQNIYLENQGDTTGLFIDLAEFCDKAEDNCTYPSFPDSTKKSVTLYVYFTEDATGTSVDPTSEGAQGGLFFTVLLSSKFTTLEPTLTGIRRGDTGVTLEFENNATSFGIFDEGLDQLLLFAHNDSTFKSAAPYKTYKDSGSTELVDFTNTSQVEYTITNLSNDTLYNYSFAFVNKYGMGTRLSSSVTVTPSSIEGFLEANACYLVSAGFQRDHYVLDYFRFLRDKYLLNNAVGNIFVHWYYGWSPTLGLTVAKSPALSFISRGFFWGLYYFIRYFWMGFVVCMGSGLLYTGLKRKK